MTTRGFTLIEVLIATAIMVGAILILSNAWSGNFLRVRKAQLYNNVAELLERKMTEIEVLNKDKSLKEISDQEGDFGKDFPQYRWTFKTQAFEMPDLTAALTTGKSASQDLLTMLNQLREIMSQSILEGTVTVYVQGEGEEVSFSVTTYFIDFNKPIALPGMGGGG